MEEDQQSSTKRVVAGGLFALFCALVIAALAVFGIISMTLGHIFMVAACLVGGLLIWTEVIPSKPVKHKVAWTLLLWLLMGGVDFWIVKHKEAEEITAKQPLIAAAAPTPAPATAPPVGGTKAPYPYYNPRKCPPGKVLA